MLALVLGAIAAPVQGLYAPGPRQILDEEALGSSSSEVLVVWTPDDKKQTLTGLRGYNVYGVKDRNHTLLDQVGPRQYYAVVPGGYDGYYVKGVGDQSEFRASFCTFSINMRDPTIVSLSCPTSSLPFEVFLP